MAEIHITDAYRQPVDAILAALRTDAQLGLSEPEAEARRKKFGRNELAAEDPVPDGALDDPLIPDEEPALPEFAEPVVLPDVPPIALPEALFS